VTRDPEARNGPFAVALLSPVTVLYVLFLLAPVSYFLAVSLFKFAPAQLYTTTLTGENYARLLFDSYYRGIIFNTFRIATIVTAASLILSYALAYYISRAPASIRGLLLFLVIAPLMTGIIVRTYGWIVLLGQDGIVNQLLIFVGFTRRPLQLLNTEGTVIVALVHIMLPYMVFPIFSALVSQDPNLVPAASTLGARPWRAFLEVTLPLSRAGIVMGSALVFTLTAGAIVTPQLLGGRSLNMIGQQIYQLVLSTFNWPLGAALAGILVLCQFVVISLYFRRAGRAG
jgi:ABC-type spermidine/putrescine transport system permease subunit I